MAEPVTPRLLKYEDLNDVIKNDLEEFFKSEVIGKRVDFISKQRENPNPNETRDLPHRTLTEEETVAIIRNQINAFGVR